MYRIAGNREMFAAKGDRVAAMRKRPPDRRTMEGQVTNQFRSDPRVAAEARRVLRPWNEDGLNPWMETGLGLCAVV